jgi:hypothetical protein
MSRINGEKARANIAKKRRVATREKTRAVREAAKQQAATKK